MLEGDGDWLAAYSMGTEQTDINCIRHYLCCLHNLWQKLFSLEREMKSWWVEDTAEARLASEGGGGG